MYVCKRKALTKSQWHQRACFVLRINIVTQVNAMGVFQNISTGEARISYKALFIFLTLTNSINPKTHLLPKKWVMVTYWLSTFKSHIKRIVIAL